MYVKFQKLLMTGCRDMDKNIKTTPKMGFSPFVTPKIFFQKSGSITFVPLWCPNFMQKLEKTNEQCLRYLKTDTRMDGLTTEVITKDPFGLARGPKWYLKAIPKCFNPSHHLSVHIRLHHLTDGVIHRAQSYLKISVHF